MKKLFVISLLMIMTICLYGEIVILKDGKQLKGELAGKQEDIIYLQSEGKLCSIVKGAIREIRNEGSRDRR